MGDALYEFGEWLEVSPLANALLEWPHTLALISSLHYFTVFLVVGTGILLSLRVLGVARQGQSVSQFAEALFPWMWTSATVSVVTGFLLFVPGAGELFRADFFGTKMIVILLAFVSAFIIQRSARKWDQPSGVPMAGRITALISLLLWIGAILAATEFGQYA